MEVELVSEGPRHCFAGVGNVLLSVYWGSPEASALDERIEWVQRMAKTHGQGGLLVVVSEDASGSLPDAAFREKSRAQSQRFDGTIVFSAAVIEGEQLTQTLVRTFLRGLSIVASRGVHTRFFDRVPPATQWAAEQASPLGGPDAATLQRSLESVRARRLR